MKKAVVIIKIGSSILLTERNKLDEFRIAQLASQIACLRDEGINVVLIVSGAVACGSKYVEQAELRQVAAGIGQAILTSTFHTLFSQKKLQIAQILLTQKDIKNESTKAQLIINLSYYFEHGFIPVINENDIVELNSFEGNDYLAAEIVTLLKSEKIIMLSTMAGSKYGIGGGKTKMQVKMLLQKRNINMKIVDGKVNNILLKTLL